MSVLIDSWQNVNYTKLNFEYIIFGDGMFGVSPAYFFSRYTTDFTVENYIEGLKLLQDLGIEGFQLEVYHQKRLDEWISKAPALQSKAESLGMKVTQFVAHFLLMATGNQEALLSDLGIEEMKRVTEIVTQFPDCRIITLPLAPFQHQESNGMSQSTYSRLWNRLSQKLLNLAAIAEDSGRLLALELVPGSLMGSTEGFLRFCHETQNTTIGYNFDTGHAWSSKENIIAIPAKLAGRIYGTHLKDNDGNENRALPPGEGTIPWKAVLDGLVLNGYTGSYDLEIACANPDEVTQAYEKGKSYLEDILETK